MTAERWGPLVESLPQLGLPPPTTRIVVVAAHPDDEALGVGGLIALAAARGHPTTVVLLTGGEASHPASRTHSPTDMAALRRAEFTAAMAELAPGAVLIRLGFPDGAVRDHIGEIACALEPLLARGPAWVFVTWRRDRHPDHEAAALAVARVAADRDDLTVWHYPVWAWHWFDPDVDTFPAEQMRRVPLDAAAQQRRARALVRYRSQTEPLSDLPGDEPVVTRAVLDHANRPFDVVIAADPAAIDVDYFDAMYENSDDPWGIGSRWYETRKRQLLLACLPRLRFAAAFEPGCAAGHLTVELAARCDLLMAADPADRAVQLTRTATAGLSGVRVERMAIPEQWPEGVFDLILLSEVGYYASDPAALAARLPPSLAANGVVALCHWRRPAPSHPSTAEAIHDAVRRIPDLRLLVHHEEPDFLIDVLDRTGRSVAQHDGIVG